MPPFNWPWLRRSGGRRPVAELAGQLAAIEKSHAVIEFDLHGNILTANQNFLDTMGYALPDIVGQHHRMFVDEAAASSPAYRDFWLRLGQGMHDAGRYKRITSDGCEVWLQASYNPVLDQRQQAYKVVKYATDITAQQQSNADAQGQLAAIAKVQAIIEFDLQGNILTANDLFLNALGYRLEEIVGQHHSMFVQPAERQSPAYGQFWQKLARGINDAGQYLRIGKNGRQVWIEASYNPILDADGQPFKVVKFATDITRRFTAAQTLRITVQGLAESVDRANHANQLAHTACNVAEAGGDTVREMIQTMENISSSSRQISDIIGVMDSIAFQTNILALNASVEAARAGEQGKGFAVVADEVRTLAQNSASAAKEIKQLIQTSVQQVQQGAEQVRKAGSTMEEIVTSSHQVTSIMSEVVQSSLTQSAELQAVTQDLTAQDVPAARSATSATSKVAVAQRVPRAAAPGPTHTGGSALERAREKMSA